MCDIKILKIQITFMAMIFVINTVWGHNLVDYKNQMQLNDMFYLSSTTTWLEFALNPNMPLLHEKKWAWIGLITFTSKIPLKLEQLNLLWHGEKIENLQASLYQKKEMDKDVVPVEKNLICDGVWNSKSQALTFNVNQKVISINNYYLFLSFPTNKETSIKHGHFVLPDKKAIKLTKLD